MLENILTPREVKIIFSQVFFLPKAEIKANEEIEDLIYKGIGRKEYGTGDMKL